VNKCADKFLKHSERVGTRFAELSQQVSEKKGGGEVYGWTD
jgi:hypothetical protein